MFERYTEKARRVIFFARCEASHYGWPFIETEKFLGDPDFFATAHPEIS